MGQVPAVCELRYLRWAGNYSYLQSPSVYTDGFSKICSKSCNVYPWGLTSLSFFFLRFIHLFSFLLWLCCAVSRLLPGLFSRCSECGLPFTPFMQELFFLRSTGSGHTAFSSCASWALEQSCGTWLSGSTACGSFQDQGSNLVSPTLQGRSLTTGPPGKPYLSSS